MNFFSRNKPDISAQIELINMTMRELEHRIKLLTTDMDLLRGQFNRKLNPRKKEEENKEDNILVPTSEKPF